MQVTSIDKLLEECGQITYKIEGRSMEPMIIPNRDLVTIRSISTNDRLEENDVVLYRKKAKLVLHRIVSISDNDTYVLLGDNCSKKEYGISRDVIIGVLISFLHNGKFYDCHDKSYLDYVSRLREDEVRRTKHKLVYDLIVSKLEFLPPRLLLKIKKILRSVLLVTNAF